MMPVFPLLMVITIDFARVYTSYLTINACASVGAIYACQGPTNAVDTTAIKTAVKKDATSLNPALTDAQISSTTGTYTDGTTDSYTYVDVTVNYSLSLITNYPGIGSTANVSRTVRMRVAQTAPD
jgi:Flp pilus assembly protein TadG